MDVELLSAYLPMDRRHALAAGQALPDRAEGAVLIADIAGFTPLTNALATALGPRRGAEELARLLNAVYEALVTPVHHYGGSIISFSGDAFTAWFDGDPGLRAVACGLALQQAIRTFRADSTSRFAAELMPDGGVVSLSLRVAVAAGPVRRFAVGAPQVDVLAGATLNRLAQGEQLAHQGEVVVGPTVVRQLGAALTTSEWRAGYGVVDDLVADVADPAPWSPLPAGVLTAEQVRPYLLSPVYERLLAGQAGPARPEQSRGEPSRRGEFLAELRPVVALFLRFGGLDYDGDDDAGRKLDAYIRWVQEVLGRYGGYLLQLTTGDKGSYLYAAFGALTAHEDDAARAVAAAMALRQPPSDLAFIAETRIGLSQGRVWTGAYGSRTRRTYGVQGDEVNLAARLMQAAPPGEIRCSRRMVQAVGARWVFEALPAIQVKGFLEPLPVYRPLRQQPAKTHVAGALVGRRAEVAVLTRLLADVRAGQRRVLLLEGEAGIGKSRLVGELKERAWEPGVAWLEGAGQSIEQGTPYRAWRDLLATYFALDEGMSLEDRQRRVRERVIGVSADLTERVPLLNDVLRLDLPETDLTRSFDPQLRHESLTGLVVDLLRAALATGSLVLVLEDAHWLDSLSWELVLSVARAFPFPVGGDPRDGLLLLLALRPLEARPRPAYAALARLEGVETLRLEALSPAETVALAAARLGLAPEALPAEVADLVRERAGGNPFFAEELAYALRDSGTIVVEEGRCTLAGDLATLRERVPDTVEGVVLSRIDRLPPERQLTLKVAAVIGRSFLYRTLRDVHPRQVVADLLRAHLDDLTRRDLTLLEALEPELAYLFKHVITQQVAYDTLLFAQRRELHRAVAGWYERVYDRDLSPYYPLLVHHWHRAEDVDPERRYARLAGKQAAAQFANAEAVTYLSRALDLTPEGDLAQRYDLLLAREAVHDLQGAREAQNQDLAALERLAEVLDKTPSPADPVEGQEASRRGQVALRRSGYAEATGDYPAAIAAAQAVVRETRTTRDVRFMAEGHHQWGRALWRQSEFEVASHQLETALELARRASLRPLEASSLHDLGLISHHQGNYARARTCFEQSRRIFGELGDRRGEARTLNGLGMTSRVQGNHDEAWKHYEQAWRIFREIGDRRGEAMTINNLGPLSRRRGDYAQAVVYHEQALRIQREIGDRWNESSTLSGLGLAFRLQGDYARAKACYEQALGIQREIGNRIGEDIALDHLGTIALFQGDYAEAKSCYEQSLRVCREVGDQQGECYELGNLGTVAMYYGDYAEAWDRLEEALHVLREIGDRRGEAITRIILSLLLHYLGDDQTAREYAQQGLNIAQELGDRPALGQAWTNLGHAQASLGHLSEAARVYQQALDLRRELGEHHLALEPLAGLARVSLARGDLAQARAHAQEILDYLETNSLDGIEEPFRLYQTCYQVCHASHDPRAREILTTAHTLLQEQAVRIKDEALRRSFLENVAAHREIVHAWKNR